MPKAEVEEEKTTKPKPKRRVGRPKKKDIAAKKEGNRNAVVLRQAQREGISHLMAIRQPDSERPAVALEEFSQVDDFAAIMPATLTPVP